MKKLTASKEDYLKAIWNLSERNSDAFAKVGTNDLSEFLRVSPPAVSRMLKQMKAQLLVLHFPYHGVLLTDKGHQIALKIVRRHRLIELFLNRILEYSLDSVHEEAERLEHYISENFEQRIDSLLNFPERCPHGRLIPRNVKKLLS